MNRILKDIKYFYIERTYQPMEMSEFWELTYLG